MERLVGLRNKRLLSQTDVANALGISRQSYGHYETGKRTPDPEMLKALAEFFEVSIDYLVGNTDIPEPISYSRNITDDEIKVALFDGDKEVTDEMWDEVKGFIAYVQERERKKGSKND